MKHTGGKEPARSDSGVPTQVGKLRLREVQGLQNWHIWNGHRVCHQKSGDDPGGSWMGWAAESPE